MADLTCPACGEHDRLTGRQVEGEIEVTCSACGHRWLRGQRRCRKCGGVERAIARQRMTTFPRGNQLAVIGMRDVPLCPSCDSKALAGLGDDRLLDDGYRSCFVSGSDAGRVVERPRPEPSPRRQTTPRGRAAATPRRPASQGPRRPLSQGSPAQPARAASASPPPAGPTVRHAVQAYLEQAPDAVSAAAMLVVGRTLGPTTRMADVTGASGQLLADAVDEHWAGQKSLRGLAVAAIEDAFRYWSTKGWIAAEQVPRLRARP